MRPKIDSLMEGFLISLSVFTAAGVKCSYWPQLNYEKGRMNNFYSNVAGLGSLDNFPFSVFCESAERRRPMWRPMTSGCAHVQAAAVVACSLDMFGVGQSGSKRTKIFTG